MELLIILIVLALLLVVILGPIGFFLAIAAEHRTKAQARQIQKLSAELSDTRSLALRLYNAYQAEDLVKPAEQQAVAEPVVEEQAGAMPRDASPANERIEEQAAAQPEVEEEVVAETESQADEPAVEDQPSTLQHLLDLRRNNQEDQPKEEQGQEEAKPDAVVDQASEEQETVIERQAAVEVEAEPVATNVTATNPPAEPYEPIETPPRRLTIEEVLAGKVFVWIGAISLVLTGAFLLKLGFAEGIITAETCVIVAGVLGLTMWGVGEYVIQRAKLISQALCGAAVAVLYGTILAADHFNLLGPGLNLFGADVGLAFGLMAVVTALAVVLSLRHGPVVAILGMLGGFMMPPLLVENMSPTLGMVLYLIAIEVGVLAVTGKRGWFGISLMTLIFSVVWSIGYALIGDNPHERTLTAMLVLGTAAAYIYHTARIHRDPAAEAKTKRRVLGLSIAATCSALGVVALLSIDGEYSPRDLSMLGVVALGTLILARLDARQIAMPFVAMAISALVLLSYAAQSLPLPPTENLIAMSACFGGLFLIGGYACMWNSGQRKAFALMAAIAGPTFYGIVFFAGHDAFGLREHWWPYTLGLAGIYALAALPMLLRRKAEHDWPIALFSVLSFVLVCVSLGQAINHPWFAVSIALVSAVAALIDLRLFIRPLRLAACIVAFVSAGLLVAPGPFDLTIHGGLVFNTLLPMYLVPAIAFATIAWCAHRVGSSITARNLTWLSMATLAGILLVLTRHIYQPADFNHEGFLLYEWSTYATVLLLAGFVTQWVGSRLSFEPIQQATRCIVGVGAILGLIGGLIPSNPLFHDDAVGGVTLTAGLLALYAAPAALMWLWSRRARMQKVRQLGSWLRVSAIVLTTVFVGMLVRIGFQTNDIHALELTMFECTTYGLAWLALGTFIYAIAPLCTLKHTTRIAGRWVFCVGLTTLILGNALVLNPLWFPETVGEIPVFNGLWYLYAPLIAVLALLARKARQQDRAIPAKLAGFLAVGLSFMLLSMFIRHGFSGNGYVLIESNLASAERYAYSLAWVLFGGVLLVAGVFTRLDTLRYGSLAVLLLAVGKVFLIDTANLDNLYRVFSFFGLGVTLIGLGYLYQRLVFKRPDHPIQKAAPQT